jgi:hypothetical protein
MTQLVNQIDPDNRNIIRSEYDSVEEFAAYAEPLVRERPEYSQLGMRTDLGHRSSFYGSDCPTPGTAFRMARDGWDKHLQSTIDIARDAVETVEAETTLQTFTPVWDVTGAMVDVGEYLAGVPECMIEIPPSPTTRHGRVVTLCASISYSSAIKEKTLTARGKVITALALELSRLGISTELYADFSSKDYGGITQHIRVLVKGPNDVLDPAKILFAYAHPGMLRVLALTSMHGLPQRFQSGLGVGSGYGSPCPPEHDLPEGTIYLPELYSNADIPSAAEELTRYLTELGLVNA